MRWSVVPLLLSAALAWAAPPKIEIPSEVKPTGQYCNFSPKGDATSILYVGLSGVDPVPSLLLRDGKTFLLDTRGLQPGRYRFAAVASGPTGEQSRADFEVLIGDAPPTPPGPGPGPGPAPTDPLTKSLQEAYGKETAADKAASLAKLAAFYEQGAEEAKDEKILTWGQYFTELVAARDAMVPAGLVPLLKAAALAEFRSKVPASPAAPFDAAARKLAAEQCLKIAAALKGVRP